MELDWREKLFNQDLCNGNIKKETNGDIVISGSMCSHTWVGIDVMYVYSLFAHII